MRSRVKSSKDYLDEREQSLLREIQYGKISIHEFEDLARELIQDFNWGIQKIRRIADNRNFDVTNRMDVFKPL